MRAELDAVEFADLTIAAGQQLAGCARSGPEPRRGKACSSRSRTRCSGRRQSAISPAAGVSPASRSGRARS